MIIVGIADMKISDVAEETLATFSLGSCVGVSLYDPETGIGGMIHCMLPMSKLDPAKAKANPFMFTDTGVQMFLQKMFDRGATKKNIVVKVAGGGNMLNDNKLFKIGERNYTVLRKILWKNSMMIHGEDVGGGASRTMYLHLDTGVTEIRVGGEVYPI